jgi:hypothetical protein
MNAGRASAKGEQTGGVMKKLSRNVSWVVFTTAVIALSASAARADEELVTKVPFAFVVGDVRLPPGDYVVKEMAEGAVFSIESTDGRQGAMTQVVPASPSDETETQPGLQFKKYGNLYFLARITPRDGDEREIVLAPSVVEHELVEATKKSGN